MVDHEIRSEQDAVDFRLVAMNRGKVESHAHWAQPCVRVDRFTGVKAESSSEIYLPRCFVFVDDKLTRMPTQPWAREAVIRPGRCGVRKT